MSTKSKVSAKKTVGLKKDVKLVSVGNGDDYFGLKPSSRYKLNFPKLETESETESDVQRRNTRIENKLLKRIPKKCECDIILRSDSEDDK